MGISQDTEITRKRTERHGNPSRDTAAFFTPRTSLTGLSGDEKNPGRGRRRQRQASPKRKKGDKRGYAQEQTDE